MTLFSYEDWYATGGTRRQMERALATGVVRRVRRGVLTDAETTRKASLAHRLSAQAAARYLGPRTFFSHFSAAVLHGLPLLPSRLNELTVIRTGGGHGSVHPTLHARDTVLTVAETTQIDGLPVTSLVRTVSDLARMLPFHEAVMVLDCALRRGAGRPELLSATRKGRGCRRAERSILFADGDAESPGESLSRVRMYEGGLVMPVLQKEIRDAHGRLLGRTDFWWEAVGVVGEFDGKVKYDELVASDVDVADVVMDEKQREQSIQDEVRRVVRWTWADLWDGTMLKRLTPLVGTR